MLVYHGTNEASWKKIRQEGIVPRRVHGNSNWDHSVSSNPDAVYLTDAYALYFSLQCVNGDKRKFEDAIVIEIDTDLLDRSLFVADEDALEQVSRRQDDGLPKDWSMEERTSHYRSRAREFAEHGLGFEWSMKALGTCGYVGSIPKTAITRVAKVDIKKAAALCWEFMNAMIVMANYKYVGHRYKELTKTMFDSPQDGITVQSMIEKG